MYEVWVPCPHILSLKPQPHINGIQVQNYRKLTEQGFWHRQSACLMECFQVYITRENDNKNNSASKPHINL